MHCYARPLLFLAIPLVLVLAAAGLGVLLIAVAAMAVTLAVITVTMVMVLGRTQRRRAAAGGCTTCRHSCQQDLIEVPDAGEAQYREPVMIADSIPVGWPHQEYDVKTGARG